MMFMDCERYDTILSDEHEMNEREFEKQVDASSTELILSVK